MAMLEGCIVYVLWLWPKTAGKATAVKKKILSSMVAVASVGLANVASNGRWKNSKKEILEEGNGTLFFTHSMMHRGLNGSLKRRLTHV